MKYGGQGGWRAVKRFNRDARIADGSSPYGYRTRYSGAKNQSDDTTASIDAIGCLAVLVVFLFGIAFVVVAMIYKAIGIWGLFALGIIGSFLWLAGQYRKRVAAEAATDALSKAATVNIPTIIDNQCTATTTKGHRCKRSAVEGGLCKLHSSRKLSSTQFVEPQPPN